MLLRACMVAAGLLMSLSSFADWQLENQRSSLQFISVKNAKVTEVHTFLALSGSLTDAGKASVNITLDSVQTGIDIRDNRMKQMLFETASFPTANISGAVDMADLKKMVVGEQREQAVKLSVNLHGVEKTLDANFIITLLKDKKLSVQTTKPILVNAADFGLDKGIAALQEVAGLSSIASTVPVMVTLVFEQK